MYNLRIELDSQSPKSETPGLTAAYATHLYTAIRQTRDKAWRLQKECAMESAEKRWWRTVVHDLGFSSHHSQQPP
jgi:hypothetical protein